MKKTMKLIILILLFAGIFSSVNACHFKKNDISKVKEKNIVPTAQNSQIAVLPTMNSNSSSPNRIWVGTFQIVWNEVIDNLIKSPIEFVDGTTQDAKNLNKREFNKTDISDSSYYTTYGFLSPELKNRIEKAIKEKFNETSDILKQIDFTYNPQKILFYAMLKKDFKFLVPFDELPDDIFGTNQSKIKYFGIKSDSLRDLYKNVNVLFYNSPTDYAVKLKTQSSDEVILYKTSQDKKFNEYFEEINDKTEKYDGKKFFGYNDKLKIPEISLYQMTSFADVEHKAIKNTDFIIDKTLETVDFKMNNEGVKLKSEAIISVAATSAGPAPQTRYFNFDNTFVLFLIEKNKEVPYFALRVNDVETINKTSN